MSGIRVLTIVVGVAVFQAPIHAELPDLSGLVEEIHSSDPRNAGIDFSITTAPEYGENVAALTVESVGSDKSRADLIRVVLQSLDRLAALSPQPEMLVVLSDGTEKLLLEGSHLTDIAFQMSAGKPMPAWTMFIENAVKPDGSRIELPNALLPRTTAALEAAELIRPSQDSSSRESLTGASYQEDGAGAVEKKLAAAAEQMGAEMVSGWLVQESVDPVNERTTLMAVRFSDSQKGDEAQLVLGCVEVPRRKREIKKDPEGGETKFQTRLAIRWDEYLGSSDYKIVILRFDEEEAETMTMFADKSSTKTTGEEAVTLVRRLISADSFVARVQPYDEPNETVFFDVRRMDDAISSLKETCGW